MHPVFRGNWLHNQTKTTACMPMYACISLHSTTAVVAVDSSYMTASSSASWSIFSPPSNFVSGHVSTMWFMVCRWTQSQEGDWAKPHFCRFARHDNWPVRKRPCVTREIKIWLSNTRVGYSRTVDHRSWQPVLSPLRSYVDRCHVWPHWAFGM